MAYLTWIRAEWDRFLAALAVIGGLVALIIGYVRTSKTAYLAEQMPLVISGALGGVFFLAVGAVLWLSADMRDEWRELHAMSVSFEEFAAALQDPAAVAARADSRADTTTPVQVTRASATPQLAVSADGGRA